MWWDTKACQPNYMYPILELGTEIAQLTFPPEPVGS